MKEHHEIMWESNGDKEPGGLWYVALSDLDGGSITELWQVKNVLRDIGYTGAQEPEPEDAEAGYWLVPLPPRLEEELVRVGYLQEVGTWFQLDAETPEAEGEEE